MFPDLGLTKETPDRIVLDLDPGSNVRWPRVIQAARHAREILSKLHLKCWIKTTGGRGVHVVIPIAPERDWSECLAFARAVSMLMVESDPEHYTVDFRKSGREDKILVDYLRNNRTNTSVCAFAVRAREFAPVSMPIAWADLESSLDPARFNVKTLKAYLARRRADPWRDYWRSRQRLQLLD